MNIILIGKNGQVGWELLCSKPQGSNLTAYNSSELDITNKGAVNKAFDDIRPDVVINAAAYTAVDKAEEEKNIAFKVNAEAAGHIARLCANHKSRLIQISTDFIFDGEQSYPYRTTDQACPLNVYGASKLKGEELVLEYTKDKALIIRTAWVYSTHGNNFVKTMLRLMSEHDRLNVISDQIGSPTYAARLANVIWKMVDSNFNGIYHWTDSGVASWYDFAVAIYEEAKQIGLLNVDVDILPIPSDEYPTPAKRPPYSVLDKQKSWKTLGLNPTHWRVELRNMLNKLK